MLKLRLFPSPSTALRTSLSLLAVLLASCAAPAPATESAAPSAAVQPGASLTLPDESPTPSAFLTDAPALELPSATPAGDAQPIATSRGPNLEASDPTTVNLASGQIQFVEFFQFW